MSKGKKNGSKEEAPVRGRTILIVDDDPQLLDLLEIKLSDQGYRIRKAASGLDAIRSALEETPDLVVLDVMMPEMDGYQVCRYLKALPPLSRTPILFLTARRGVTDRQRGLLQGGADYLYKPFDLDELAASVARLLEEAEKGAFLPAVGLASVEPPAAGKITKRDVVEGLNKALDEDLYRVSLLAEASKRLVAAADRDEIVRITLACVVSRAGMGWGRALIMLADEEKGELATVLAAGDFGREHAAGGDGRGKDGPLTHETLDKLLTEALEQVPFRSPGDEGVLEGCRCELAAGALSAASPGAAMGELLSTCRGGNLNRRLKAAFGGVLPALVPIAGRGRVRGVLAAEDSTGSLTAGPQDINYLGLLCHQAGLALERSAILEDSKKRARQLEELTLFNERLTNGIGLGITFVDPDKRVSKWNRAMASMSGIPSRRALGEKFLDLCPGLRGTLVDMRMAHGGPRDAERRVGHFSHSFSKGREGVFDVRISDLWEGERWLGTVQIWEEVTMRITLEQKVRSALHSLQNLVENSGDAILTLDGRGRIKSWNDGAAAIFGYQKSEAQGKAFSMLWERGRKPEARALIARTLAEGRVANYRDTLVDARSGEVSVSISTSRLSEDGKEEISAIIRDVTDRLRLESQLLQTEKLASLGIMAAGMAHEINNPLTSILMHAQILDLTKELGGEAKECIGKIEEETGRIAEIIDSLLVFSRPSSQRRESVDIADAAEKAIRFIEYHKTPKEIRVVRAFSPALPPVLGVPTEIQEIFLNLLVNARDAMPEGGKVKVRVRPLGEGMAASFGLAPLDGSSYIEASVIDEGTGIPREDLKRIYDPFFTTKPPGKGTGLGLAVVKRLVDNHEGCISVRSLAGEGTTFTVCLPAVT